MSGRDERLDVIRGFACLSFVAAHFEAFTWFNFIFWERLGIFSGAELFVIVSGLLVGITHREIVDSAAAPTATERLWRRAGYLYLSYVGLIALVALVRASEVVDVTAVTTFTDRWAGVTYPLYPPRGTPLSEQAASIILLQSTPHQIQILGFYICVLLAAPLAVRELRRGRAWTVIVASWAAYGVHQCRPMMPTCAQFEYAFPLLAWQLYFFNALAIGYRARYELPVWLARVPWRRPALMVSASAIALASFLFAQATDNTSFPAWSRLDIIAPETFRAWYDDYFLKNTPGVLRIASATSFLIVAHALLTRFWGPVRRACGPLLLPLGRNSLYVFLIHVVFIAAADQIPGYFDGIPVFEWQSVWLNTALLTTIVAAIWLMIRHKILFRIIPR